MLPQGFGARWNARVGWSYAAGAGTPGRGAVPGFINIIRGGKLVPVIPKTSLTFDGRSASTQRVPLKTRIDARAYVSAVLVVRVHAVVSFVANAAAYVRLYNESVECVDEGTFFVEASPIATVTITATTPTPLLLVAGSTGALADSVRVVLEWSQQTQSRVAQSLTLGVDVVGRTHVEGDVVPRREPALRLAAPPATGLHGHMTRIPGLARGFRISTEPAGARSKASRLDQSKVTSELLADLDRDRSRGQL